ncbi:protein MAIN-LIKE [Trifolium repens]|nr:protein MAIN-LIKE [Trifolium repens]
MEEDVGRTRLGRETRAHASAREVVAPRPKRGRSRRQSPVPFQGRSDYEAGGSSAGGSMPSQAPEGEVDQAAEGLEDVNPPVDRDEDNDEDNDDDDDDGQPPVVPEQGYGGGPSDLSLLHDYHKHRANQIWEATNCEAPILKKVMRSVANGKNVINLPKLARIEEYSWFWKAIEATGLEPLTRTSYSIIDHGLMTAFAERWHPETNNFHLPIGEVAITLDDIQCRLHLPITGRFLHHSRMRKDKWMDLLKRHLGVEEDIIQLNFDKTKGLFRGPGAAALVYLQAYMAKSCKKLSEKRCGLMAGYMSLLQGWVISHMPRMSVRKLATNWNETLPCNARYEPGQGHRDQAAYREHLDNMQMSDFVYTPYTAHRQVRPLIDECWFSGWLRCGGDTSTHLPERVLRQFGYVQTIPRPPAAAAPSSLTVDKIDQAHSQPPEPPHLEVLIERQAREGVRDHFTICQNVRLELERTVRDCEALPGTPIYETVQRLLSMVAPAVVYSRRRRAPGAPQYPYRRPPGPSATQ